MSNSVINDLSGLELGFPFDTDTQFPNVILKSYAGTAVGINVVDHDFKNYTITMPVRTRAEEQTFLDFYDDHTGQLDTFLFLDPKKNFVSRTQIATGDGVEDKFQLKDAKGRSRYEIQESPTDALIWVAGVPLTKTVNYSITYYSSGELDLVSVPILGQAIEAEFYYWRRVRFVGSTQKTSERSNRNILITFQLEEVLP